MAIAECFEALRNIPELACQASEMIPKLDPNSPVDRLFCNAVASHIIMITCVNLFVDNWPLISGESCLNSAKRPN